MSGIGLLSGPPPRNLACGAALPTASQVRNRRPQHLLDMGCTGREHDEPVEPERNAARPRHDAQRADEIIIAWIALVVDVLLGVHLREQPSPLLVGISQFTKAVGEFDAAEKNLEALGHARIAGFGS